MKRLWKKIKSVFRPAKPRKIWMKDPEGLWKRRDSGVGKNYRKYKKTYTVEEVFRRGFEHRVRGRKVKYWKVVATDDFGELDEVIPIYYKKRKRKRRKGG